MEESLNDNQILYTSTLIDTILLNKYSIIEEKYLKDFKNTIGNIKRDILHDYYLNTRKSYGCMLIENAIEALQNDASIIQSMPINETIINDINFIVDEIRKLLEAFQVLIMLS